MQANSRLNTDVSGYGTSAWMAWLIAWLNCTVQGFIYTVVVSAAGQAFSRIAWLLLFLLGMLRGTSTYLTCDDRTKMNVTVLKQKLFGSVRKCFFINIPADSVTYAVNGLAMYKCIDWEAMMILGRAVGVGWSAGFTKIEGHRKSWLFVGSPSLL